MNDKTFFKNCMVLLKDQIHDLETWSVNNNDTQLKEILELKKQVEKIEKSQNKENL